jgi:hypothetical protein
VHEDVVILTKACDYRWEMASFRHNESSGDMLLLLLLMLLCSRQQAD